MKTNEKIKVFIVDDDNMLVDGIAKFFKESNTFEYLDRANHPVECLTKLEDFVWDVDIILMDVKFPKVKMDGIQLARKIRELYPGNAPRIAFMTISDRAIVDPENGFHGLIPKNQGIRELMGMLEDIHHKGEVFYPPKAEQEIFLDTLTGRQKKILCLTLKGQNEADIAKNLNVTPNMVLSHQKVIISKIKQFGIELKQLNDPGMVDLAQKYKFCEEL